MQSLNVFSIILLTIILMACSAEEKPSSAPRVEVPTLAAPTPTVEIPTLAAPTPNIKSITQDITVLESGETKRDVLKPIFTFDCVGLGGSYEAAVGERVACSLDRAVTGQGPGEIATITWSAPDGLPSGGTDRRFVTYYYDPGFYEIQIEACSSEGGCTTYTQDITVLESGETKRDVLKPIFTFDCVGLGGSYEAAVGERVACSLDRAVTGQGPGEIATITWSAPGGLPSGGTDRRFVTHYYDPGFYEIQIEACSSEGGCTTYTQDITVLESGETKRDVLKPIFTFDCVGLGGSYEAAVGERVACSLDRAVTGQGPGEIATITWSAPGGLPSGGTDRRFVTYYYDPGFYEIQIEACSSEGGCTTYTQDITVLESGETKRDVLKPIFTFNCVGIAADGSSTVDEVPMRERMTCSLDRAVIGQGPGEIATITWSAPGGLPSGGTHSNFETYYYDLGSYEIQIEACSSEGGCTTYTQTITAFDPGDRERDVGSGY